MDEKQVGSSAMPQKNNPIYFEKAEANLLVSNALWNLFSNTLPVSRMQRDLRDSSLLRNVGSAFSYMIISLKSIELGFSKLSLNQKVLNDELEDNSLVILEGIVARLKLVSGENKYETFKLLSREKNAKEQLESLLSNLEIEEEEKKYLKTCKPNNYTGIYKL
tara:strand:+ start:149 stop:637 length:489 start_codon:yes stop_codon:yes gene_type:complete